MLEGMDVRLRLDEVGLPEFATMEAEGTEVTLERIFRAGRL